MFISYILFIYGIFYIMLFLYIGICFLFIFSKTILYRPRPYISVCIQPRPVCMYPARIIPACRYSSRCVCRYIIVIYIYSIIVNISQPCRCYVMLYIDDNIYRYHLSYFFQNNDYKPPVFVFCQIVQLLCRVPLCRLSSRAVFFFLIGFIISYI